MRKLMCSFLKGICPALCGESSLLWVSQGDSPHKTEVFCPVFSIILWEKRHCKKKRTQKLI